MWCSRGVHATCVASRALPATWAYPATCYHVGCDLALALSAGGSYRGGARCASGAWSRRVPRGPRPPPRQHPSVPAPAPSLAHCCPVPPTSPRCCTLPYPRHDLGSPVRRDLGGSIRKQRVGSGAPLRWSLPLVWLGLGLSSVPRLVACDGLTRTSTHPAFPAGGLCPLHSDKANPLVPSRRVTQDHAPNARPPAPSVSGVRTELTRPRWSSTPPSQYLLVHGCGPVPAVLGVLLHPVLHQGKPNAGPHEQQQDRRPRAQTAESAPMNPIHAPATLPGRPATQPTASSVPFPCTQPAGWGARTV